MITDDRARRVFALEVAGLPVRYTSGSFDPSSSNLSATIATGISYRNLEAIVSVGAFGGSVDPSGGVANYSGVSITLASDRVRGTLDDPSVIFGRCGARASGVSRAQITSDLLYTVDSGSFTIDTDLTSVLTPLPALLHIGAETIRVTGLTSSTVTYDERAVGSSQRQSHEITQEGVNVPEVSTGITTFRGRRASLWCAHQYPDGTLSSFTELVNGFVESSPIVEEGGTVSLSIMPLTALLDTSYSVKSTSTKLLHGYHYYGAATGCFLEWAVQLKNLGGVLYQIDRDSIDTVTNTFTLQQSSLDMFWFGGPKDTDTGFDRSHPRYPMLKNVGLRIYPTAGSGQTITYDPSITEPNPLNGTTWNPLNVNISTEPEIKIVQLGSNEVKRWPEVITEELATFGPTSSTGVDGAFARWTLTADEQLSVRAVDAPERLRPQVVLNTRSLYRMVLNGDVYHPRRWSADAVYEPLARLYRLWYPIDIRAEDDQTEPDNYPLNQVTNIRTLSVPDDPETMTAQEPIRDIARGYYQWRETRILVEDRLEWLPTSATSGEYYWIDVKFYDRVAGAMRSQLMQATHQTPASFDGSTVGYLIHLRVQQDWDNLCSFGDWSEGDRVEIHAAASFTRIRPAELMLQLLQSGGGGQKLGTYDVLSLGLSIPSSNIDEASFLAYDQTSPFVFSGSITSDGLVFKDLLDSLLKAMGCVMIMQRDLNGRSKITLQPIGAERAASATQTISAEDWLADQPPTWSIYEDVVTQTAIRYDYDTERSAFNVEAIYNNQEAINRYGGERSQISLDLYALSSRDVGGTIGDTFGYFLPVVSRIWNLLSNPLRSWRGSIGTGKSLLLDVGSYVKVSSPHLKGYGDAWGVTDAVGMVQSIHQELMSEGAQIDLIATGLEPVAWNSSAKVTGISSPTALAIAQDIYSDIATDDSSFFAVGDVVDYLPEGDHDNATTGLEISDITGNIFTFTAAHGVTATGGTLEPTTYLNASAAMQSDAYLASDASPPVLGLNTKAQRYS
jgi:hypothetical protein